MRHTFKTKLWRWSANSKGSWFFVTLPKKLSKDIKSKQKRRVGFGSIRVIATIGQTSWSTSIFPSTEIEAYVLPIKKEVRKKEGLEEDKQASVAIVLQE